MSAVGFFDAFVNANAYRETPDDRALIAKVAEVSRSIVPGAQVRWAGSQRKRTDIVGSDLDMCLDSSTPVTEAQRRDLRKALEGTLSRAARVQSHVIRLPANGTHVKVDIAFANAAFGSRPPPDTTTFHNNPSRQCAARAIKLWTRRANLPPVPGWVVEALVIHLDAPAGAANSLDLFLRVVRWLDASASVRAFESILRPVASPRWNPEWSRTMPGRIEALRNHARALLTRKDGPDQWRNVGDAERWLRG